MFDLPRLAVEQIRMTDMYTKFGERGGLKDMATQAAMVGLDRASKDISAYTIGVKWAPKPVPGKRRPPTPRRFYFTQSALPQPWTNRSHDAKGTCSGDEKRSDVRGG